MVHAIFMSAYVCKRWLLGSFGCRWILIKSHQRNEKDRRTDNNENERKLFEIMKIRTEKAKGTPQQL